MLVETMFHHPTEFWWVKVPVAEHLDCRRYGTHRWHLHHRLAPGKVLCEVRWDDRHGWDGYSMLTGGYVGWGGGEDGGYGDGGEQAAKAACLRHACEQDLTGSDLPMCD